MSAQPLPPSPLARPASLPRRPRRVASAALPIERYDNGPTHAMVCLATPAEVSALRPDLASLARLDALCA